MREWENKKVADAGTQCLIYTVACQSECRLFFLNLKCLNHVIYTTLSVRTFWCFDSYFLKMFKRDYAEGLQFVCVCAPLSLLHNNKSPVPTHTHFRPYDCAMVTKEQFVWSKTVAYSNTEQQAIFTRCVAHLVRTSIKS